MSDLYNQIVGQEGRLQSIAERIPGFRGYLDNKARREADRMLRDYLADMLSTRINRFVEVEKQLLNGGGLSYMSETSSAKTRLQTYRDRVKAAAPGYSGFFAMIDVTPEKLDALYSFDEAQVRYIDRLDEAIAAFSSAVNANEGVDAAITGVDRLSIEAMEAFALREDVLTGLDKELGGK